MSEIFEGFIFMAGEREAKALFRKVAPKCPLSLALGRLGDSVSALYRNDERSQAAFRKEIDSLASEVSLDAGTVLVARYDSRSGYASSNLYRHGTLTQQFDEEDEVYVLLGEDGMPQVNGRYFRYAELDPDAEYDTLFNAIQLGLEQMGASNVWPRLLQLMNDQGLNLSLPPPR